MTFTIAQNYWIFTFLHADDANLFFKYKDLNIIESEINSVLGKVNIWLLANKLSVNIAKSTFVNFNPVQKQIPKKVILFVNHQLQL